MNRFVSSLVIVGVTGAVCGSALLAQPAATASSGIYSSAQAKRGQAVYGEMCSKCHLDDLTGGTSPPLVGTEFLSSWKGKPVGALFDEIKMTMPFDNPGGLTPEQYGDVLAYVLSVNKYPAGDKELAHETEPLQQITLDEVKP
jgi:mono/diheme cytochrome c family protein